MDMRRRINTTPVEELLHKTASKMGPDSVNFFTVPETATLMDAINFLVKGDYRRFLPVITDACALIPSAFRDPCGRCAQWRWQVDAPHHPGRHHSIRIFKCSPLRWNA